MARLRIIEDNSGRHVADIEGVSYVEGSVGDIYIEKENGTHFSMSDVKVDQFQAGDE